VATDLLLLLLLCSVYSIFAAHEEPLPQEAVPTGVNEIKGPAVCSPFAAIFIRGPAVLGR
jgi:hypothetical protein